MARIYPRGIEGYVKKRELGGEATALYRGHFLLLISLVTLVLAGAILGGVLGTQLMKNDTSSQPASNSTSNVPVLDVSRLAACNLTEPDQILHKSVFLQDTNEHTNVRRWDSSSDTWQTTDITAQYLTIDSSAPQATRGSTLASSSEVAPGDSTATETVFSYDADNIIQAYSTAGSTWKIGDLNGWHGIGYANSELAATIQYIGGETYVLLAHQDSDRTINVYNMSSVWSSPSSTLAVPRSGTGQRPTPMTMAPFYNQLGEGVCLGFQSEVYNLDLKQRNLTLFSDTPDSASSFMNGKMGGVGR